MWWDMMAHTRGVGYFGCTFLKDTKVYWVYWWHFDWDLQALAKSSILHMVYWVEKYICNEQHGDSGPSWVVHLHRHWLSWLLPWCEYLVAFECLQELVLILHPWWWLLWILIGRSRLYGWKDIYYVKDKANKTNTKFSPCYNVSLQQDVCKF
jgi:hypothetical protein